mmetsp:Transcript_37240/g.81094  ORF Transcript_37240/g.81094 Transcript_37240/m.81094 type:complete len:599 (-) Transcript_37240:24-1820(-)
MQSPYQEYDAGFTHYTSDQVQALLAFMEIDSPLPFKVKMSRSGKNVDSVVPIRNVGRDNERLDERVRGGPPPKRFMKMTDLERETRLRTIFSRYYGSLTAKKADPARMDIVQYHKFLRDAKLLDNKMGFDEADRVFRKHKDKEDRVNFEAFHGLLKTFAESKYPTFSPELALKMVYQDLFKYGLEKRNPDVVGEKVLSPAVLRKYKPYEENFKYLFSHYATLSMKSADVTSWKAVKGANRCLSLDELTILLLNFDVFPRLLSKRDLKDIFKSIKEGAAAADFPDNVVYPEFLEVMGRIAAVISNTLSEKINNPYTSVDEMVFVKKYILGCGPDAREHFYALFENRAGESAKVKEKMDHEARVKAADQMRKEREYELEHYHRAQLAASRQELLSRVSSRWTSDGINTDRRAMGGQAGGQVYGRGGMSFGPPPHITWTGRAPNRRGKVYLDHLRPGSRSKVRVSTALTLGRNTMSEFIDMDMDDQSYIHEWKRNTRPPSLGVNGGVMADADLVIPEIDNFERRLQKFKPRTPSHTTLHNNEGQRRGQVQSAPTAKLPGISDRRLSGLSEVEGSYATMRSRKLSSAAGVDASADRAAMSSQ